MSVENRREESSADSSEEVKVTPDEAAEECCWWVITSKCNSGGRTHIPRAVNPEKRGIPDDPDTEPPSKPLCGSRKAEQWVVKGHDVMPPGWVDDDRICDRCSDDLLEVFGDE
jgi:hypothetical protein